MVSNPVSDKNQQSAAATPENVATVSKVAASAAEAAVTKAPAAKPAEMPAVKPAVKPAAKRAVKPVAKPAAKPAVAAPAAPAPAAPKVAAVAVEKTVAKPSAKVVKKNVKPKKAKLVRDSFSMPELEYGLIATVKKRCIAKGVAVKKSEVLRAAIIVFAAQSDAAIATALAALDVIKTGRPPKGQK